jgi:hypothetical protein
MADRLAGLRHRKIPGALPILIKLKAPLLAQCAVIASCAGDTDGAQALFGAKRIAAPPGMTPTPITNMQGIRFCFGDEKSADAYDDLASKRNARPFKQRCFRKIRRKICFDYGWP